MQRTMFYSSFRRKMEYVGSSLILKIALHVLVLTAHSEADRLTVCPKPEELINCQCEIRYTRLHVVCKNFDNFQDMSNSMRVFKEHDVFSLELDQVNLLYLPGRIWKSHSVAILTIKSSEILGLELEDSYEMFGNVMRTLEELRLENVSGLNSWRWKSFENCYKINHVTIINSDLSFISEDFSFLAPDFVAKFDLYGNKIGNLHERAFLKHKHLMSLDLSNNLITNLKRSMFPVPSKLILLYLGNNKIKTLPNDVFSKMPDLVHVDLRNNQIKLISSQLLRSFSGYRREVILEGNDILCCSSMRELITQKISKNIRGECANPSILKGKKIDELNVSDVTHSIC